ncbi:DUF1353 domain-containing protein [Pseudomonas mosselii]|jgi:hypothetical protein|uniref:DUF1353 domain-containing protein n=1 Tax=Pseudomonas mosselii TaxID=78327 RepID=A0AA42RY40_9PSED|nr:DUF1353 domain-containing protein [Pseudomonas mosselii]MDH1632453.1 DUF1353 domain-containing protein [Pseudomonas mosselii]
MRVDLLAVMLVLSSSAIAQDWGKFSSPLNVELMGTNRDIRLLQDFTYTGPGPGKLFWLAPKDTVSDGASIPKVAWGVVGGPLDGQYRQAAIIHDVACVKRTRSWQDTHRAFYTGMRAAGIGETQAKVMYGAVYHFGPRWAEPEFVKVPRTRTETFDTDFAQFKATLPPGKTAELISDGRVISRTVSDGLFTRESIDEVVGAVVEVREVQPPSTQAAFDKMRSEIERSNPSLDEIEKLPVSNL